MKKRILPLLMALALALTGCASLLERSYTVVEPYTDRYWDSAAEDTLRAESYQDLVNSLLMLVEQRAEDGIIRYYAEKDEDIYFQALNAQQEVRYETALGAYLLDRMTFLFSRGDAYTTLTFSMTYREEAGDPESLMVLSDTQSLVDLLRMAVREGHEMLTARFFTETAGEDVEAAVESLWQELHQDETVPAASTETPQPPEGEMPPAETTTPTDPEVPEGEGETPAPTTEGEVPAAAVVEYPPCPWTIRFYPDRERAEIVEILLTEG